MSCVWGRLSPSEAGGALGGWCLVVFPEGVLGRGWPEGPSPARQDALRSNSEALVTPRRCRSAVLVRGEFQQRPGPSVTPASKLLFAQVLFSPKGSLSALSTVGSGRLRRLTSPVRTGPRGPSWARGWKRRLKTRFCSSCVNVMHQPSDGSNILKFLRDSLPVTCHFLCTEQLREKLDAESSAL